MTQRRKRGYQHWNTPPEVIERLHAFHPIDLDPCSNEHSVVGSRYVASLPLDGLCVPWHSHSHTFVNPPYDNQPDWMRKAGDEREFYGAQHITMLIPASTETVGFRDLVFGTCDAICFWSPRLKFWRDGAAPPQGQNTLPSALVYWGVDPLGFARHFSANGTCVTNWIGKAVREDQQEGLDHG